MQTKFLIFIAVVFVITIIFGILIWRQTLVFEKKALAAKQRKDQYLKQLEEEQQQREQTAQQQEMQSE
jgi:predicted Holliday junction resolvase-like endonuclease